MSKKNASTVSDVGTATRKNSQPSLRLIEGGREFGCPAWIRELSADVYRQSGGMNPVLDHFAFAQALGISAIYTSEDGLLVQGDALGLRDKTATDNDVTYALLLAVAMLILGREYGPEGFADVEHFKSSAELLWLDLIVYPCIRQHTNLRLVANDNAAETVNA